MILCRKPYDWSTLEILPFTYVQLESVYLTIKFNENCMERNHKTYHGTWRSEKMSQLPTRKRKPILAYLNSTSSTQTQTWIYRIQLKGSEIVMVTVQKSVEMKFTKAKHNCIGNQSDRNLPRLSSIKRVIRVEVVDVARAIAYMDTQAWDGFYP